MQNWILKRIKSRCVRQLAAWLCAAASIFVLGLSGQRDIENFCFGPYDVGQRELDAVRDVAAAPHYFVRVTGSDVVDTGVRQTVTREDGLKNTTEETAYYALAIGEKFLIVKSPAAIRNTVTGELAFFPNGFDAAFFNTPEMRSTRSRFYPFMVDSTYSRYPGYAAIACASVFVVLFAFFVTRTWRYLQDPMTHPTLRKVASWGDPNQLAFEIEREASSPRYKRKGWSVTENYLVRSRFFTFDIHRIADVVWAYKRVTKHWYYLIPVGKSYESIFVCKNGVARIPVPQKLVDEILAYVAVRAPWAEYGYTAEFDRIYRKRKAQVCAAIELRRAEYDIQSNR